MDDMPDFFAPPPFKPDEGLVRLRRELRDLGLQERDGVMERRGQALVRARIEGATLVVSAVREPARSPQWSTDKVLKNSAELRDFLAHVKTQLSRWSDRDD